MLEGQNIEEVLGALGYGRRTVPLFFMLALANMVQIQLTMASLLAIPVPFRCHSSISPYLDDVAYFVPGNQSTESVVAAVVPITGTHEVSREDLFTSECLALDSPGSGQPHTDNSSSSSASSPSPPPPWLHYTGMASCPYIEYDHSLYSVSIVSEFHLVCERAMLRPFFHIMSAAGTMLGAVLAAPVCDCLGRLKGLYIGVMLGVPAHVALAFMSWYPAVLVLRVVMAVCNRSILLSGISLAMESIPSRHRSSVGILMGVPYSLIVMLTAIASYFLRAWRYLHLFSGISLYLLLPLSFMVEESPRWLAQNGLGHKAAEILRRAADYDRVVLPPHLMTSLDKLQVCKQKEAISEVNNNQLCNGDSIFRQFRYFPCTLGVLLDTTVVVLLYTLMYYSVMLNSSYFGSTSSEMYVGLSALLEGVGLILVVPMTQRLGRRSLLSVGGFSSGTLVLVNLFVPEDLVWLRWLVMMVAIFNISGSFQITYLYVTEVFPTVIRSRGLGITGCVATLGSMMAPLVIDTLVQTVWWGCGAVMVITGAVITVLVCFLPETNNVNLPDTIKDLEDLRNGKKPPLPPPPPPPSSHVV